ncbi:isovaleryl-CoA dehydrogenase [Aureococcus anophagefferens]|nr:isovaleryl-CoA dehydrogenase [Aureococcus anophagefferens]
MLVATRALARRAPASSLRVAHLSTASALEAESERFSIYNPTEEHVALRQMVRSFAEQEVDPQRAEYNEKEQFNRALFARCGELGLLGVTADESCGGSGMDAVAACVVHEELSAADPAFALSYLAHSMLYVNNVNLNASEDQKRRWLPGARDAVWKSNRQCARIRPCDGSKVCAMAMSEPGAGTDVLGMRTAAVDAGTTTCSTGPRCGSRTAAPTETPGDGALVYARTGPGRADVSLFHVGPENPGFSLGQRITGKLGMRASPTAELVFEDCVVPKEDLVSEWNGAALCMMRNLELERVVLAAMAVGIAKRCVDRMGKYAAERVAFGRPIAEFGQMQRHVAEGYAKLMAARAYLYATAVDLDLTSTGNRLDTDGVKLFATAGVHGGYGYVAEYQVEQLWRDAELLEIGGGTLESHHNMIRDLAEGLPPGV